MSGDLSEFQRGRLVATVEDHERRLAAINGNIAATARALEELRVALARYAVAGGLLIVLTNALVALAVYELTR